MGGKEERTDDISDYDLTLGAFWFGCRQIDAVYPRRANYSHPTCYANRENVHASLDAAISNL